MFIICLAQINMWIYDQMRFTIKTKISLQSKFRRTLYKFRTNIILFTIAIKYE